MEGELFGEKEAPVPDVLFGDMLACVDRELKMRRTVYPRWVAQKKLSQAAADLEMRRLRAVRARLLLGEAYRQEWERLGADDVDLDQAIGEMEHLYPEPP